MTAPADPTKSGYTFAGWDTEIPATMPAENITITAQWTINQYTITFADTGDNAIAPITQDYNTAVTAPADPTKTGYTFAGWDTVIPATMPAQNLTITAQWTINQYTITFADTGDTVIAPITQDYNTAVTAPADPTKVGYTFAGWDTVIPATMPAQNLTITAQWNILTNLTVTYDPNGGYFTADDSTAAKVVNDVTFNSALNPGEVARDGYSFAGWFDAAEGGNAMPANMPGENATYYAQWIAGEATGYTIEYYYQNAADLTAYDRDDTLTDTTNVGQTDTTATVTAAQIAAGEKTGFEYNEDASTLSGTIAGDGSLVLKVYFDRLSYAVTFYAEGDTVLNTTSNVVYGTNVTAPEAPAKTGNYFLGWAQADDVNETLEVFPVVMPAHALSYVAIYDPASYAAEYYVDGARVATALGTYGDPILVPPFTYEVPTGYQLGDTWYTDAAMTQAFTSGTFTTTTVKLYNTLSPIEYNAIFDPAGGQFADDTTTAKTVATAYGAEIAAPADPTRDGYTFQGWSPDVSVMEARDMTFTATWIETDGAYTLTYYLDDAETVWAAFPVALNDEFDVPADPVKEGYVFQGWAELDDATNTVITLPATVTEDRELKAVFTIDQFTATIQKYVASAHGPAADPTLELLSETDYDYQANVVLPAAADMAITNYTFTGWVATDEDGVETVIAPDGTLAMPASDLTIVPTYERVAVKLVPKTGTTTMIERKVGNTVTVESYNEGYTVTPDGYNATTFTDWYVYGLKTGYRNLTPYVDIQGDGTITYVRSTLSVNGYGTGAQIVVTDNVTGEVVETFTVVVYGDLNGDARVNGNDKPEMAEGVSTSWSGNANRNLLIKAANLDGDRRKRINGTDMAYLETAIGNNALLDQVTGLVAVS